MQIHVDKERREFLKLILFGGGALFVGKFFNPIFSKLISFSSEEKGEKLFEITENKKMLSVYDSSGEEIFQIDKEA